MFETPQLLLNTKYYRARYCSAPISQKKENKINNAHNCEKLPKKQTPSVADY